MLPEYSQSDYNSMTVEELVADYVLRTPHDRIVVLLEDGGQLWDTAVVLSAQSTPKQQTEAMEAAEHEADEEHPQPECEGFDKLLRQELEKAATERGLFVYDVPEFPYPGARILSLWVGEQVKYGLEQGATDDEICSGVKSVLSNNEKRHGPRPISA